MDIFEFLKDKLGCMYISDLKFGAYKEMAIDLLKEITADSNQITDVYNYIMGGIKKCVAYHLEIMMIKKEQPGMI